MGYLGQEASFTGTQNNKRLSVVATAGQTSFFITNGYAINAIDVYRNGVKLIGQRDFSAIDGVTVTLTSAANVNDVIEFVIFENFAVNDVVSTEGDSVIKGNLQINGNFSVVNGALSAGISSSLGVGATAVGLNASGIITATSFVGSGADLTTLNASNLASGTIPDARFPATLPAINGANLTGITAGATLSAGSGAQRVVVTSLTSGTMTSAATDAELTYNSTSNTLSATTFSGALTGNADSATTATTATNAQGLTGTPDITVRNIIGVGATLSGVLTYEDVTNIDSVGIITARSGINVTSGGANIVGVVTATTIQATTYVGVPEGYTNLKAMLFS